MPKQEKPTKTSQSPSSDNPSMTPPLVIQAQYIKDLSFENPNPLQNFTKNADAQPKISIDIQAKAQNLGNSYFEVVLDIHASAKREEEPIFLLELSYAGIAHVADATEETAPRIVMVDCPHLLFPFARNIVADVTRDAGFPPLFLGTVDFATLYEQQQAKKSN